MRKVGVWLALLAVLLAATAANAQRVPAAPGQDPNVAEMIAACTEMMGQMQQMMGMMGWRGRMMGWPGGMMGWPGGMMGWPGGWWFGGAWLFWLVLLALAVTVVVLLVRQRPANGSSAALAALQLRFAKGEISAEEYEQTRRILRG
jgi:putative membrane protein